MQAEISCHRVRKVFGKGLTAFEAITAATFSVAKGSLKSIHGPSGCGKSTLLMMIAALEDGSSKCTFSDRDDGPESLGLSRSCDGAFAAGAPRRCNPQAPSGAFRRDAPAGIALPRAHCRSKRFADGRAVQRTRCHNARRQEHRAARTLGALSQNGALRDAQYPRGRAAR